MLDALITVPVNSSVLADSWEIVEKHHIYQADAIQIVSLKASNADYFLSADHSLIDVAKEENTTAIDIENSREVSNILGN